MKHVKKQFLNFVTTTFFNKVALKCTAEKKSDHRMKGADLINLQMK